MMRADAHWGASNREAPAMTDFDSLVPSTPDRFAGIARTYTAADVARLRGSVTIDHTLARRGAERLWELLTDEPYIRRCRWSARG